MDAKESSLQLINRFDASKAKGVNAIIQIKATGEGNNTHAIIIKDGKAFLRIFSQIFQNESNRFFK